MSSEEPPLAQSDDTSRSSSPLLQDHGGTGSGNEPRPNQHPRDNSQSPTLQISSRAVQSMSRDRTTVENKSNEQPISSLQSMIDYKENEEINTRDLKLDAKDFQFLHFRPTDSTDEIVSNNFLIQSLLGWIDFSSLVVDNNKVSSKLAKVAGTKLTNHAVFDFISKQLMCHQYKDEKKEKENRKKFELVRNENDYDDDNMTDEMDPEDEGEASLLHPDNIENRRKLEYLLMEVFENVDDPTTFYFDEFACEIKKMLEIILSKYQTFDSTSHLTPDNNVTDWSSSRMSREHHFQRFTRWDAALATAIHIQMTEEKNLFYKHGYVIQRPKMDEHCARRAIKIERIVNEPLVDDTSVFCYQQYSLMDIAERKNSAADSELFCRAIKCFEQQGHKLLLIHSEELSKALKWGGVNLEDVKQEITKILSDGYLLPEGKLLCRLVLNVAELFFFSLYNNLWMFRMQGGFSRQTLFKGIPFGPNGKLLLPKARNSTKTAAKLRDRTTTSTISSTRDTPTSFQDFRRSVRIQNRTNEDTFTRPPPIRLNGQMIGTALDYDSTSQTYRSFQCAQCNVLNPNREELIEHFNEVHKNEAPRN